MRILFLILFSIILSACNSSGSVTENPLAGMDKRTGFLRLFVDTKNNRVLTKLPDTAKDGVALRFIYTTRLTAGLGSNPVGLDRGWGDSGQILVFRKMGKKVIIEAENMTYRAKGQNPLEAKAVKESFARSFLASADVIKGISGEFIDLTDFLTSDRLNLVQYLSDRGQGSFSLDKSRSLIDTKNVFSFPDNTEIDVFMTFSSTKPGQEVATTAANGRDVTLIQHHSFVRLPEPGYVPLRSDPRAGVIEEVHYDYSVPLSAPIETRLARRYRLEKNEDGTTKKPIIFYIDGGAPEPVRSALVEGAMWWKEAFAAAGYPDGYRVEILPEDAHPLDIRYNMVQWVHRQTRGWSYGGGVSDPRTGEMLKGHVNLGSLRVRQDRMIFEGLAGVAKTDTGFADDPVQLSLERIRQLSAHEVGHALGFAHNFAASTYDFGSVMDYPAPNVTVENGALNFETVYGKGVGAWDKYAATWLYGNLTKDEREALTLKAIADGLKYVADTDARNVGTAHPEGNIWDNGSDPVAGLRTAMEVRRIALNAFGLDRIQQGQPVSDLNKVLVPIYLYHRYQTAAAVKLIGGMSFNYGVNGDGQPAAEIVDTSRQKEALAAVLETVSPTALDINDDVLQHLTPSLISYSIADSDRELFRKTAFPAFDVTAAADTAADLTFDALLHPRRAARLIEFNRRDRAALGFTEMLQAIRSDVMKPAPRGRLGEIAKGVQARFVFGLMDLSNHPEATPGVKARVDAILRDVQGDLSRKGSGHGQWLVTKIDAFLNQAAPERAPVTKAKALPPGGPIGMGDYETCWHCEGQ